MKLDPYLSASLAKVILILVVPFTPVITLISGSLNSWRYMLDVIKYFL
jgi:hypothetical protein